jgi:two-component system chemotaxis response regulator CheB
VPEIRVLVVDDSGIIRRLISDVVNREDDMTVCGTAENGRIAVERARELKPHVMTLDVEMPELSGLEALPQIRKQNPMLPIVMFSTLTVGGGKATLEALSNGASDFVTKPNDSGGLTNALARIRADLIPKIRALAARETAPVRRPVTPPKQSRGPFPRPECVAIAVSTGGPRALEQLVPLFAADFPVPIVAVQHMPATFTKLLAERLDRMSSITVTEAVHGEPVEARHMYIAPGEHHLTIKRSGTTTRVALNDGPPEHSCRPAADVLFRSAVGVYGPRVLGVVLTGMGEDGSGGARAISDAGGRVIVQDRNSSVVWGMPGAVVQAGLADGEFALDEIAPEITRAVGLGRVASARTRAGGTG